MQLEYIAEYRISTTKSLWVMATYLKTQLLCQRTCHLIIENAVMERGCFPNDFLFVPPRPQKASVSV